MASKTQVSKIITALKPQSTLNELTTMRQDFFNGNFRRAFDTFSILHKKKSDLLKSLNSKDFHGYSFIRISYFIII